MDFLKVRDEYFEFVRRRQKKQSFDTITTDFNFRIAPYFTSIEINKVTINNWYNEIESHNFSNSYNKKLFYTFSKFLDYCVLNNYIEHNYLKDIGVFKKHYEPIKYDFYTYNEFKQFITGFTDNERIYKSYFSFLYFTGCRPSEAMALRFSDLKGSYISINKNIERHGKRNIDTPKTKSSIREIIIDKKTLKDILKLKSYYEQKYNKQEDYFIFGGIKPLSCTSVDRHKNMACDRACIRRISVHQFRHSHATLLLHKGMLINEVSRRLGHSKVDITLNVYTHTNFEQEKRVQCTLNHMRFNIFNTITTDFKYLISILKHISMF